MHTVNFDRYKDVENLGYTYILYSLYVYTECVLMDSKRSQTYDMYTMYTDVYSKYSYG